jgi:hypothetical protein
MSIASSILCAHKTTFRLIFGSLGQVIINVNTEINSASRCDQNDTIIIIVRLLCNKLSIITNKGGILVWRLWGAGGCPGNPSNTINWKHCDP